MNYSQYNEPEPLWNRFQRWRVRHIESRIQKLNAKGIALLAKMRRINASLTRNDNPR